MPRSLKAAQSEIDAELLRIEWTLRVQYARMRFRDFVHLTMPDKDDPNDPNKTGFQFARHNELIIEAVELNERGECPFVICCMPPRHTKSECISRKYPAWAIGRHPAWKYIFGTYSGDFAEDFGRNIREAMLDPLYLDIFPDARIKTNVRAADLIELKTGGVMVFAGVGGPILGRGGDLVVIDDPFKNQDEADSQVIRDKRWDWFANVIRNRLQPGGRIFIVMQRWHEDDIVGRIYDPKYVNPREARQWVKIELPALKEDANGTERALWPQWYPVKTLRSIRDTMDPRLWSAMFQQKPTPEGGAFFEREHITTYQLQELPKNLRMLGATDFAAAVSSRSDKTCSLVTGIDPSGVIWVMPRIFWKRSKTDLTVDGVVGLWKFYKVAKALSEKGQLDSAIGPFLKTRMIEKEVHAWVKKLPTVTDKGKRAESIRGMMALGMVRWPGWVAWWPDALSQLLRFTGSGDDKEDDLVDAIAMIGQELGHTAKKRPPPPPSNVIRIGTMAWVKAQANRERRTAELLKARRGM